MIALRGRRQGRVRQIHLGRRQIGLQAGQPCPGGGEVLDPRARKGQIQGRLRGPGAGLGRLLQGPRIVVILRRGQLTPHQLMRTQRAALGVGRLGTRRLQIGAQLLDLLGTGARDQLSQLRALRLDLRPRDVACQGQTPRIEPRQRLSGNNGRALRHLHRGDPSGHLEG